MSLRVQIKRKSYQEDRDEKWKWWEDTHGAPRATMQSGVEETMPTVRPMFQPAQIYDFFGQAA